jgi:competence protein ComEC
MFIRLFQSVPAFRLLTAYITGLVFFSGKVLFSCNLIIFSFWLACSYRFFEKRLDSTWNIRWMPCTAFICFWIALGSFSGKMSWEKSGFPQNSEKNIVALADLKEDPIFKKRSFQLQVKIVNASDAKWNGKNIVLYLQKEKSGEKLRCGDRILVRMCPQKLNQKADSTRFDYARWLRIKGFCATAYIKKDFWKFYSAPSRWNIKAVASRIGSELVEILRKCGLSGNSLALASAMSIGYRDKLDKIVESDFRSAGITHILSVSGLHVAVIYSLFQILLFFLGFNEKHKKIRQLLIILLLWCYAFVTGLSPSVIRSVLMFSMISLGGCLEKKSSTLNTIFFSAFILLLWKPLFIYDVGFELSYCAVLGIVIGYPKVRDLYEPKSKLLKYIRDLLIISLVAQLATLPLTVYYFGQFPNYFLLSNLVAVPLSSLLIFISAGCLLLFYVPYVSVALSWCLNKCVCLFLGFADIIGNLPFAVTDGLELNITQVIILYLFLFFSFCCLFMKRKRYVLGMLTCILCFQLLVLEHRFIKQIEVENCRMVLNQYICKK